MTIQKAVEVLEELKKPGRFTILAPVCVYDAIKMAIDALNDVSDRNVGDTISRQVVLNEIEEWISALYENAHHESASDGKMILNAIKHLPSAQPEPCEDCVSRKAVIRLLHSGYHSKSMIEEVKELPSAQPEPVRINLNELIKVKLTDWGKEIYYHQYDRTNQIAGRKVCEPSYPKVDEDGYTTFQLWRFIELYGEYMGMTIPNVIEPIEIIYKR